MQSGVQKLSIEKKNQNNKKASNPSEHEKTVCIKSTEA